MSGLTREQVEYRIRDSYKIWERGARPRYAVARHTGWSWSVVARAWTERGAERIMQRRIRREIERRWFA